MDVSQKQRPICKRNGAANSEKPKNELDYLNLIPERLLLDIMKTVPQKKLVSLAPVCLRFNSIINDRSLWEKVWLKCDNKLLRVETLIRRQVQVLELQGCVRGLLLPSLSPALEASWSLKEVNFFNIEINPDDLAKIFTLCNQLRKVHLEDIILNNDVLLALSNNKEIDTLRLRDVRGLEPSALATLLKNVKKLQNLEIFIDAGLPDIDNCIFENLAPSLLSLIFGFDGDLYRTTHRHVSLLVNTCPLLQDLDLEYGYDLELTASSMELLRKLKHLRTLKLPYRSGIPPSAFLALTEMESLEEVNILSCIRTDEDRDLIEELLRVKGIQGDDCRCGTFRTKFGVVSITY